MQRFKLCSKIKPLLLNLKLWYIDYNFWQEGTQVMLLISVVHNMLFKQPLFSLEKYCSETLKNVIK